MSRLLDEKAGLTPGGNVYGRGCLKHFLPKSATFERPVLKNNTIFL
jgi:hypothetical protein